MSKPISNNNNKMDEAENEEMNDIINDLFQTVQEVSANNEKNSKYPHFKKRCENIKNRSKPKLEDEWML